MKEKYDIYSEEEDIEKYYKNDTNNYNKPDNAYRIKKVNEKRIKALKRKVIKRVAIFGMVAVGLVSAYKITTKPEPQALPVPEGYQEMMVDEYIDNNETIEDIAQKYYTEDVRTCYPDFEEYIEIILKDNNIKNSDLYKQNSIKVPVIVDENNHYLKEIAEKEKELEALPEWIGYTVQAGDTLSTIAWNSAANGDEAVENLKRMAKANNLESSNKIIDGQRIKIINPMIGTLKREIESLKEEFNDTITIDNNNKSK